MSKDQVEQQLREFPSVLERLELPERLIISCKQRRLSPDEIRTSIDTFLAAEGLHIPHDAFQNVLSSLAPVYVTKEHPGLVVQRIEPDLVRRQIRFLLWTSNEPRVLPFYVTVEEPRRPADRFWSSHADAVPAYKARFTSPAASPAIMLVSKGKPAKLVVETQTLRMTVLVTPLESGVQGQVIRVRNSDTQRVFKAEVVGKGLLQASLAEE